MAGSGMRSLAAGVVLGFAALSVGLGVRFSTADEPKAPDLTELRDAVKAASKRGDNVDEVEKALAALEKSVAKGFTPPAAGATAPVPPELSALRDAVEAAGRKGENVADIRKQLEAVEKAMTGKVLTPPKPLPPPADLPPRARPGLDVLPQPFPFPDVAPFGGGNVNPADIQKAQEKMLGAMQRLMRNANDPEARKALEEARDTMLKALAGGGFALPNPNDLLLPDLNLGNPGFGRVPERFRLGIRLEKLSPLVVDQLGLDAGRGVAISSVVEGSPAEKAGLKPHDIVLEFAGKAVGENTEDLVRQVNDVKAGDKVDIVVLRKGKKVELKGVEIPAPQAPARPAPGRLPEFKPLLPELKPLPAPKIDRDAPLGRLAPPGRLGGNMSVTNSNGNFTIKAEQNGVKYTLRGTTENGTPKLGEAVIDVNGQETKADSLEKVPEEYRPTVEKLLKSVGGTPRKARVRD
jgi:hypothetical protein